jgi:hypothetical protein
MQSPGRGTAHAGGRRTFLDRQARWFPEGTLEELPDIEANRAAYPIITWALEPGDAILFHMLALHGAPGVTNRRRVLSVRFVGDDIRHAPRRWKTSPHFPGLGCAYPAFGRIASRASRMGSRALIASSTESEMCVG